MKALFINNLTNQTNDVMVNPRNPENPDSNNCLLGVEFPPKTGEVVLDLAGDGYFWGINPDSNQLTWKLPNQIEAYSTMFVILHHRVEPNATSYNKMHFSEDKKNPRYFCIRDSSF